MTEILIKPMPLWMRTTPERLWPRTPPIFSDLGPEGPTDADRELARELFRALDEQSQKWYGRHCLWLLRTGKSKRKPKRRANEV